MSFLQQLALYEARVGVQTIIAQFGAKVYSPEELAVLQQAGDLLAQLPLRLHGIPVPK